MPTNQLACNCLTNWALTFHGFWFDRFLDKSYYIRSALKLTAPFQQMQYISQAVANCLIQSWKSFYPCGSTRVVHCGNHSDQDTSIHTFKLVENVKESCSACVNDWDLTWGYVSVLYCSIDYFMTAKIAIALNSCWHCNDFSCCFWTAVPPSTRSSHVCEASHSSWTSWRRAS